MKIEEFRIHFKNNSEDVIQELNSLMEEAVQNGKAATNCVPNEKYQFAWGTLKKELKKNGYVYDDAMIYKVHDEKEIQKLKDEIERLKNKAEDHKMGNVKEASSGIKRMIELSQNKISKDDISSISVRMPKSILERIDKVIEDSNYTKNQFIIDLIENSLDEIEKALSKDGE